MTSLSHRHSSCWLVAVSSVILLQTGVSAALHCSVCDTTHDGDSCITHPPAPTACWFDYLDCINVMKYDSNDKLLAFTRSCSPMAIPQPLCVSGTQAKTKERVKLCYWTCDTDGCNGSRSFHYQLDLTRRRRRSRRQTIAAAVRRRQTMTSQSWRQLHQPEKAEFSQQVDKQQQQQSDRNGHLA